MSKTFADLKKYCKENGIKYTETKHKHGSKIEKITITKTRAVKIIFTWGRISWSFWDKNRQNYSNGENKNTNFYQLDSNKDVEDWFDTIVELLETEAAEKTKLDEFPIQKQEFTNNILTRYTNGLVKASMEITQAYVSGVVKVTNRGIIKEIQTEDDCECWFLVDGKGKCASRCDGIPTRLIYDGEKNYAIVEKTDKAYRIAEKQKELSEWDKIIVDAALALFLTLKEKEQGG